MIRPFTPDDAEEVAELFRTNRDFLAAFEPERDEDFYTAEGQRRRFERFARDAAAGEGWRFAIMDDGAIVGRVNLTEVVRGPMERANIGYFVDHAHNGRGLASSAVADAVEFAFREGDLHALNAVTLPDNRASQRVLEKNRFDRFGVARELLLIAGEWRDHVVFERVAD